MTGIINRGLLVRPFGKTQSKIGMLFEPQEFHVDYSELYKAVPLENSFLG
jgi:hypothetical protein